MTSDPARTVSRVSGFFLFFCVSFLLGSALTFSGYSYYQEVRATFRSWRALGGLYRPGCCPLVPQDRPRDPVTVHRPDRVASGFRAILAYVPSEKAFEAWLLDQKGDTLHSWPIDYRSLDEDEPLGGDDEPHGMLVLDDGSIALSFDHGEALARIDPCGAPVWVRRDVYHHMINVSEDGSLLVWRGKNTAYGDHQFIDWIDPETGALVRSISLESILARSTESHVIKFAMPPDYEFRDFQGVPPRGLDHFHPNDVEMLTSEMAAAFPDFSAGDLLVSFRIRDLVTVIDGESGAIKWSQNGPWHEQHDPDFQPDGTITVFDNNPHPPTRGHGSSIIAIDPVTRRAWRKFTEGAPSFYSEWGGVHQALPNGTWQIVIPAEGRVVEVDEEGNLVWEFNNVMTERRNAYILNGVWLPEDFFPSLPSCSG
jgi:hypothetical protein